MATLSRIPGLARRHPAWYAAIWTAVGAVMYGAPGLWSQRMAQRHGPAFLAFVLLPFFFAFWAGLRLAIQSGALREVDENRAWWRDLSARLLVALAALWLGSGMLVWDFYILGG